jgi:hypothetical protein
LTTEIKSIRIFLAEKLQPLFFGIYKNCRYKVAYGGRGGSKSWAFADMAIMRMLEGFVTIAVCRELAATIKDSVHQLLKDRIRFYGICEQFDITDNEIRCLSTGSIIKYKHLHNNITEIKGLEGAHICWVFEAQNVSAESWKELDPTIRQEGAEIWIEFNTGTENDFIYDFFVTNTPEKAGIVKINYTDNPWCPQELIDLAEECRRKRPEDYRHIWLGEPSGRGSRVFPKYTDALDKNGHPIHLRDFDLGKIALHGQCFMAMDPATVYYPFIIWGMRFPMGKDFGVLIYNEFPTRSYFDGKYFYEVRKTHSCTLEMRELSNMMHVFDRTVGNMQIPNKLRARFVDTRFAKASGARSWTTNTDGLVAEFGQPQNGGIVLECPPEHMIDVQRDGIRTLLSYNEDLPICLINEPRLFVMPHCENVNISMKNHRFNMDNATEDEKYKDPCDTVKILLAGMAAYKYEDPAKANERRPFVLESKEFDFHHALA